MGARITMLQPHCTNCPFKFVLKAQKRETPSPGGRDWAQLALFAHDIGRESDI